MSGHPFGVVIPPSEDAAETCGAEHPHREGERCDRPKGHQDNHNCRAGQGAYSWNCWRQVTA